MYCGPTDKLSMQSTQQSTHAHIHEIIFQSPKSLNSHAALTLLSYGLSTMYMFFAALAKLMHFDPVSCHA